MCCAQFSGLADLDAGGDTFEAIGVPAGAARADIEVGPIESRAAPWRKAVGQYFEESNVEGTAGSTRAQDSGAGEWAEASIDAMVAQKQYVLTVSNAAGTDVDDCREEIENYIKDAEQKLRKEARAAAAAAAGGQSGSSSRSRSSKAAAGGGGSRSKSRSRVG